MPDPRPRISRRHFLALSFDAGIAIGAPVPDAQVAAPTWGPTLRAYLDTLIPADETPSATQAGVADALLAQAAADARYLRLLERGCARLDAEARRGGADAFAALAGGDRERLVALAAEGSDVTARAFFERTRADAFRLYYAEPRSWPALGYAGPPQPAGFPDHAHPPVPGRAP